MLHWGSQSMESPMQTLLGGGFPLLATPKWCKGGHLFVGMKSTLKTVSNLSSGLPEYGMTNANNFKWDLLAASNLKRMRKWALI